MLKLTAAMLAIALAGTASAAKWRDLRVDGSSEEAFAQSLEVFKDTLPPSRWYTFDHMLGTIWLQETQAAAAEQREYTRDDYLRQLDGLTYNEVGRVLDPTGRLAQWYRAQYFYARGGGGARSGAAYSEEGYIRPGSLDGANQRGGVAQIERNNEWSSRQN
jgi:hypothetical protein